jgi:class 3 adenylate cyclase
MERRLAAILAADVVGYSRLMEQDEAGTLAALKARRKTELLADHPALTKDSLAAALAYAAAYPRRGRAAQAPALAQVSEITVDAPSHRRMLVGEHGRDGDVGAAALEGYRQASFHA